MTTYTTTEELHVSVITQDSVTVLETAILIQPDLDLAHNLAHQYAEVWPRCRVVLHYVQTIHPKVGELS